MTDREKAKAHYWREDIDSLAFRPQDHTGLCVIHRRAFRVLIGFEPMPEDCANFFDKHRAAFQNAALAKIRRTELLPTENFHLNSRDIARELK